MINKTLLKLAQAALSQPEKSAFQLPSADGAQQGQGGPPMSPPPGGADPSMGGGMPPGGAPPMGGDPSAGGAPGGTPPGGLDPNTQQAVEMAVHKAMQAHASMGGGGAMGGGAAGGGMKPPKPDINVVANDSWQNKKLLTGLYHYLGIPLPQDIIDGPNRDPQTGAATAPNAPGSTSDPMKPPQMQQGSIPPIQPMTPAAATPKMASFPEITNRAAALAKLAKSLRERQCA